MLFDKLSFLIKFVLEIITKKSIGAIAQLGERLNGIQEVSGSIPLSSTIKIYLESVPMKSGMSAVLRQRRISIRLRSRLAPQFKDNMTREYQKKKS